MKYALILKNNAPREPPSLTSLHYIIYEVVSVGISTLLCFPDLTAAAKVEMLLTSFDPSIGKIIRKMERIKIFRGSWDML